MNSHILSEINDKRTQKLFDKFGITAQWYASRLSSNVMENGGVPVNGDGSINGYFYDSPVTVTVIRTGAKQRAGAYQAGVYSQADAVFSIPRYEIRNGVKTELEIYYKLTRGDVLVLPNYTHTDTDILTKGIRDEIWTFDIVNILSISQGAKVFTAGKDYSYVDTQIIWHGMNKPAEETMYAVKFTSKQQYLVYEDVGLTRGTDEQHLARRVVCILRPYGTDVKNKIDAIKLNEKNLL